MKLLHSLTRLYTTMLSANYTVICIHQKPGQVQICTIQGLQIFTTKNQLRYSELNKKAEEAYKILDEEIT